MKKQKLRRIILEEARRLTESRRYDSSEFVDDLVAAIGDEHMGYTVERARTDTVRFFTTSNGQRIHVHAIPFFEGQTEDMTVSLSINGETVREGLVAFYGESMVQALRDGRMREAASMYTNAIDPILEAGYGIAQIRT